VANLRVYVGWEDSNFLRILEYMKHRNMSFDFNLVLICVIIMF
jgi:hypothetical protein